MKMNILGKGVTFIKKYFVTNPEFRHSFDFLKTEQHNLRPVALHVCGHLVG